MMKLMGNCSVVNCTCNFSDMSTDFGIAGEGVGEETCGGAGGVVLVGVKLDSRSKELLTWALVKVADSGDQVIALHVIDPNTGMQYKETLISLVKTFDSLLAAYEGFCNLKQVDLKLKVSRGTSVRKVLAREAIFYGAMSLIVGTSATQNALRSSVSVAKYCARNLGKDISVISVDNGKILFQREAITSTGHHLQGSDAAESRPKRRKILTKSPLSLSSGTLMHEDSYSQLSSSNSGEVGGSRALVPANQEAAEPKSGWPLLRKMFLHNRKACAQSSAKRSSIMQWVLKLPSRQSAAAICPDHSQNVPDKEKYQSSNLDKQKVTLVQLEADSASIPYSSASGIELLHKELEGLSEKYSSKCRLYSYLELLSATSNFNPENMIGKGGSSKVYRGLLSDGKELAVKILKPSEDVLKQFVSEIEILTTLDHKNIISLSGFCCESNNLLLVYDFLSRGSLEDNLHGNRKTGNLFGWEHRYKVALGVAVALEHLHNAAAESIIHRDVKSSNVLLSCDFEPKLSDFGLAMLASSSSCHIDSIDVAGTFGYLAPEYFMHGKVIDKIDVYAYGVVLLELLSGRKPIDNGHPKGPESLVVWAKQILKGGKFADLLDPCIANSYDHDQIEKMVLAANLCIRRAPKFRPQISFIVKLLQGDAEVLKWARQQVNAADEVDTVEGGHSATNIQSFINLALLNLEDDILSSKDDTLSSSSAEQTVSVEDYLRGRYSRSSSFDQSQG